MTRTARSDPSEAAPDGAAKRPVARHPLARPSRLAHVAWTIGIVLVLAGAIAQVLTGDLPHPSTLLDRGAADATKIVDRHGHLLFEVLAPEAGRRTRVPLEALPSHLPNAVIAVEDDRFWSHPGFDLPAITRAAWQWVRHGTIISGGSTITQQLAREVLMSREERSQRTVLRKAREIVLAARITRHFERERILEMYLNEVYFGQLAYGVESAARVFFGKPAHTLDLAESAMLAGMIQSPATTNPLVDLAAAKERQRAVLDRMVATGMIEPSTAELAARERLRLAGGHVPLHAPHFTAYVLGHLESEIGRERMEDGGIVVVTSLDLDLQRRAEGVVASRMDGLGRRAPDRPDHNASDGALVTLHPATGDVLAMVGSADFFDASIDGAVNVALASRQPGSALKPLIYATAFDPDRWGNHGALVGRTTRPALPFTAATVLSDVATTFTTAEGEPYRPVNYDRTWHGPITLRRALATSSNMVAVKVLEAVGLDAALDTASELGIHTLKRRDRLGLAVALGGGEVRLLELTAAYGALANGGRRVIPRPILGILDAERFRALHEADEVAAWSADRPRPDGPRVLSEDVAWLVTDILSDDLARMPAFGEGSVLRLSRPAAAKTGTTTDFRDNWTLGYTPDLVTGVWVGNADNAPMRYISGITGAGPIWHEFMEFAHRGRPVRSFQRPNTVVRREICATSGLRATPDCTRTLREWFIDGTAPEADDDTHLRVAIDRATGRRWAEGCRGPRTEEVFRLLPPDALQWGRDRGIPAPPDVDCLGRAAADATAQLRRVGSAPERSSDAPLTDGLVITQPAAGTEFALSARLPSDAQRIVLEARPGGPFDLAELTIFLDGRAVARRTAPPWRTHWKVTPGSHEVHAEGYAADGEFLASEPVSFVVHAGPPSGAEAARPAAVRSAARP